VRRVLVLLLALGAVVALTGCTASIPTPARSAHTVVAKPLPIPDGVVGTGTLTSWNGNTTGTLQVIAKSGKFSLVLSNFSTDFTGENLFVLADQPVAMSQCGENNLWQIGITTKENNVIEPTMHFMDLPNDGGAWSDPTFFQYFGFLEYGTVGPGGTVELVRGCQQPIVALTKITWTMTTIYPELTVHDGGRAVGAEGTVTSRKGRLFTYVTAGDDTWLAIAHRFGLTPDELRYLNPIRHPDAVVAEAYRDQVLNLDPANRDNSESRRPGAQ
jgi:hypothetical protein